MTVQHVSEVHSLSTERIEFFADLLKKSERKRAVFKEIYRGQSKQPKTAEEIGNRIGLTATQVLNLAKPLADDHLFDQVRHNGKTAYQKIHNIKTKRNKILSLASSAKKRAALITIRRPKASVPALTIKFPRNTRVHSAKVVQLFVDDIENFSLVKKLPASKLPKKIEPDRLPETVFKHGVANILGNRGTFKDWGGEGNDLYSTHLKVNRKRVATAFGFKGPAKKGTLTPGKMGKNGDQIQRLVKSPAKLFIVQYEGEIAESVTEQLRLFCFAKSVAENTEIYYSVIDGEDSHRLRLKYSKQFGDANAKFGKQRKHK